MYFEKFIVDNHCYTIHCYTKHLKSKANSPARRVVTEEFDQFVMIPSPMQTFMKMFGFMSFNLIFTALIGLGGLTAIPYCFKMIKQETTKTKIFYILTFIQILLQTAFPLMRAGLVILSTGIFLDVFWMLNPLKNCTLVGF